MSTRPPGVLRRTLQRIRDRWYRTDANGRRHPFDAVLVDSPEGGYLEGIPGTHSPAELSAHVDDTVAASNQLLRRATAPPAPCPDGHH
jgi:hypothetical protein